MAVTGEETMFKNDRDVLEELFQDCGFYVYKSA
jgi:hypothetical protein